MRDARRLPPGQSATVKWRVLHVGSVQLVFPFRAPGEKSRPPLLEGIASLPMKEVIADMHCVTKWSRFDVRWEGVPFAEIYKISGAKPEAKYVMVLAEQGL